jgi:hypothetical protein
MITFKRGALHGRAIILNTPVHGIVGIVECAVPGCEHRYVPTVDELSPVFRYGTDEYDGAIAKVIDRWMQSHPCGKVAMS